MSWAHPWDDAPKSRRGIIGGGGRGNGHNAGANKRNPITGELALEQAVWSDVGKQVVAAAHACIALSLATVATAAAAHAAVPAMCRGPFCHQPA